MADSTHSSSDDHGDPSSDAREPSNDHGELPNQESLEETTSHHSDDQLQVASDVNNVPPDSNSHNHDAPILLPLTKSTRVTKAPSYFKPTIATLWSWTPI
uniref:Uncharacterized protein n=1 Tax=Cucumis sativus TaxID=3659 RepID=A0A0A0KG49_CUCSA